MNIDVAENGSLSVEKAAFLLAECLRKQKNWPKIDFDVAVIIYDWLQTCSDLSLEAVQSTIVAQLKAQIDEQCKRMRNLEEAFIEKLEYANRLEAKLKSNSKLPLKSDLEEEDEMDLLPLIKRFRESNRLLGVIKTNHLSDEADHQQNWSTPSEPMSQSQSQTKFDRDVVQWDTETICDWMQNLRLRHEHIARAQLMRIDGRQLIAMSLHDLEKDFNVKNVFDRKKLFYAIQALKNSSDPCLKNALELDTNWALRWLDDIGLPQYKKQFSSNSIDGCLVHFLTYDDLAELGVTSALHLASLQTGIQILRAHAFDPNVFKRRSLPTDSTNPNADEICLWTTHRVMDWLHSIDLAEFASNLRGSGVHGALLVHEPRFNENLLARILTISNDKTLLKRHLTTHFNRLLGPDIVYAKREAELSLVTLTLTGKIKVCKKSQFSLKRQKKRQYDFVENLICPLDKKSTEDLSTTDN